MQRFERLLDRRVMVETVDLIEVDIIRAEPTQAVVDLGEDRLTRQSPLSIRTALAAATATS